MSTHLRFRPSAPFTLVSARALPLLALALGWAAPGQAWAAKAKDAAVKEAKDSAPVLMSKTGGGDSWADLKELEQAVAKGNPKAEAQYGEMLLRGDGVQKNEGRGVALLEKAARSGNSPAAFRIGMLLSRGEAGVAKDLTRALAYFRAAAAGGEAEAFYNIGAAYASALGVKRDYAEALGWLIVAREHGAQASAEQALRAQLKSSDAIAKGELRAKAIQAEFADKKVVDFLPVAAPLDKPVDAAKPSSGS